MTVTATTTAASSSNASTSLGKLSGNFNDFLKLLMTQLQNQDPTSPMDTNQFTSQLVQFSSVEQQINTNASLTKLIQATQGSNLLQASALVGQSVEVSGDQLSLQGGQASLHITGTTSGPVTIGVYAESGAKLQETTVVPQAGSKSWTWDGKDANGKAMPDGAYKAIVKAADGSDVAFDPIGVATGVQRNGDKMQVALGTVSVDLSAVQSVGTR
jgi:flagellar basal-body rod modification protein FlgD